MGGCWVATGTCKPIRRQSGQAGCSGQRWGEVEEVMAGARKLALVGALPSACRGGDWRMGREAAMVAPPPVHHTTVVFHFCDGLGFLHKHSWLWNLSLLSPQAIFSQPTAVPSPDLLFTPHIPAPSPHVHWWTPSQAGVNRAVVRTICLGLTLSCLPQTGHWALL